MHNTNTLAHMCVYVHDVSILSYIIDMQSYKP